VIDKRLKVGVLTLAVVLIINVLFRFVPTIYDVVYFRGLFQGIRVLHDYSLGLLPFPSIYIALIAFLWYFFRDVKASIKSWANSILRFLIWVVIAFYVLWGYNYNQKPLHQQIGWELPTLDSTYITDEFRLQTQKLISLKDSMTGQTTQRFFIEHKLRPLQEQLLSEWNIPVHGRVRVRYLIPGSLLHFRTSGIYIPHSIEGHIDGGLYYKQHPFTIAHEMSHGYGITDESVANFVAYLTCLRSDDPGIVYSAELAYWRYLAGYYKYFHSDTWTDEYNNLDVRIIQDLNLISNHIKKYKDWMPKYRDIIYDNYLKTHGVKAGIKSYDQMILLIAAYKNQQKG